MAGEISVVAIVKGEERYVFMFDENSRAETLRTLGQYASDPELSFSWYDAAVLSQKIRKTAKQHSKSEMAEPHFDWPVMDRARSAPPTPDTSGDFPDIDFSAIDDMWIGDDPQT